MPLFFAMPAAAAGLTCTFTEPFFTIRYDPETGEVIRQSPDNAGPGHEFLSETVAEGAALTRDEVWRDHPSATLRAPGGEVLMVVRFSGAGSDGMSDMIYPIEGQWGAEVSGNNIGGCVTDNVPAFDIYQIYQDLGLNP